MARHIAALLSVALPALISCRDVSTKVAAPSDAALNRAGYDAPGTHRQYGEPTALGDGSVRTYVVLDAKSGNTPLELGVAIDEKALHSLPAAMQMLHLALPTKAPEPYDFVMFDWNPNGHEPDGVYTLPHFDFHFYTVPESQVMSIVPGPTYAMQASALPTDVPQFYVVPGPPPAVAVPQMGVHWSDVRSPELQKLPPINHPELWAEFTKTFIYGSWNGRFTFLEPMITLEYLLTHPDETIAVPTPANAASTGAFGEAGWYPSAYRISYDAKAKEYRVALTTLGLRQ